MRRIDVRCSFCGKTEDKVRRLVAGPGVFICDECVRLCNEVINDPPPNPSTRRCEPEKKPWWRRVLRAEALAPG